MLVMYWASYIAMYCSTVFCCYILCIYYWAQSSPSLCVYTILLFIALWIVVFTYVNHVCRDENNSQPLAIFQSIKLCGHLFPCLYDASQEGNVVVSNTKQYFVARRYTSYG